MTTARSAPASPRSVPGIPRRRARASSRMTSWCQSRRSPASCRAKSTARWSSTRETTRILMLPQVLDDLPMEGPVARDQALPDGHLVGETDSPAVEVRNLSPRLLADEHARRRIRHPEGRPEVDEPVQPPGADVAELEGRGPEETPAPDLLPEEEDGGRVELPPIDGHGALLEEHGPRDPDGPPVPVGPFSPLRGEGLVVGEVPHEALPDGSLLGVCDGEGIEGDAGEGVVGTVHGVEEDGSLLPSHVLPLPALLGDEGPAQGMGADVLDDPVLRRLVDLPGRGSARTGAYNPSSLGPCHQILDNILHRTGHLLAAGQKCHDLRVVFMVCHPDKLHHTRG